MARAGKIRSGMVSGGIVGLSALSSRRGRGVDKRSFGRPTGMYGY
jgi:hypothetical protein